MLKSSTKINVVNNFDDKDTSVVVVVEFIISFKLGSSSTIELVEITKASPVHRSVCAVLGLELPIVAFFMRPRVMELWNCPVPIAFYLIFTSFKQRTLNL